MSVQTDFKFSIFHAPLLLSPVIIPLIDGGFDHPVIYWSIFLLFAASVYWSIREYWSFVFDIRHPFFWYTIFILWGTLSIIWSLNPHRTLAELLQLCCYALVFLLTSRLTSDQLFRLGRIAWLACLGVSLFGISQYLLLSTGRIAGTFTNPNPFGIYLAMLFLLGWGYFLRSHDLRAAVGSLIILIALFLTGSRGAFIAIALALPLLFWNSEKTELLKRVMQTALIIGIALLLTQGIMLLAPLIQETMRPQQGLTAFLTRPESFIASSGVGRLSFWEVALRLGLQEPLKGYGLGTFFVAYNMGYPGDIWYSRFAHNHYLQVISELGFIGFGLFAAFLLNTVKVAWQKLRSRNCPYYYPGMVAAMIAFLIHIGVDFSWNFPGAAVVFFAVAGGISGMSPLQNSSARYSVRLYSRVVPVALLVLIFLLSAWQYSAQLLYQHGVKLELAGEPEKASGVYGRTVSYYPINAHYHFNAGRNYYNMMLEQEDSRYLERSLEMVKQAIRYHPAESTMHRRLGLLYAEAGKDAEAEKHLSLAVDYAIYRIGMYVELGHFYLERERMEEAERVFLAGLELEDAVLGRSWSQEPHLKEDLLKLYLLISELYQKTNRQEEAAIYTEKIRNLLE